MLRPLELVMALVALLSFSVIAGAGAPFVLGVALALVGNRFVTTRYSTTREQHRLLLGVVGAPFALLGLMLMLQTNGGTAAAAVNTAQRVAVVGCIYLSLVAALEVYRRPGQARPEIFHVAILMVMMVAGLTYRNRYYPEAMAVFGLAGVMLLRAPYSGLRRPEQPPRVRWDVGVLIAYALALGFAQWFSDQLPQVASNVLRHAFLDVDVMQPDVKVFSVNSDMGSLRRAWRSKALLARVLTPEATRLRGQVLVTWWGNTWTAPQEKELRQNLTPQNGTFQWRNAKGRTWTIYPVKATQGILPAPGGTFRVEGDMPFLEVDLYDGLNGDTLERYTAVTDDQPVGSTEGCLQVPAPLREPLRERAARILQGETDPVRQARKLEDYLGEHGVYDPVAARTKGADPILDFLDTGMRGYCEYFASSLALMLRVQGVPTRYVVGFTLRERNPLGGYWLVRDCDAHAWVEAWLEGRWQTLDPTPPAHLTPRDPEPLAGLMDGVKLAVLRLFAWMQGLPWSRFALVLAGALALPLLGLLALRRWRAARAPRPSELERQRREAERRWSRRGLVRQEGETWWEFRERCGDRLTPEERAWIDDYCQARYSDLGRNTQASE